MTDPRFRQRHDIPWSQPLPLEPRTLADDPLAVEPCNAWGCSRCNAPGEPTQEKPEPYKPKVGERVRLVSSPDEEDWHRVGREYEVLRVDASRPAFYWVCLGLGSGIHRDAVWAPVPAAQEPTAEPAQPEAEASEPSDDEQSAYLSWCETQPAERKRGTRDAFTAGYNAGLNRGRVESDITEANCEQQARGLFETWKAETLERDRAAHAAEVERLCAERDGWREKLPAICWRRADEVERLRVEHDEKQKAWSRLHHEYDALVERLQSELAAARAERPMPTDEELARVLRESASLHTTMYIHWLDVARAAKAELLGVRREGPMPTFEEVYGALKGTARRALSDQTRAVLALFAQQDSVTLEQPRSGTGQGVLNDGGPASRENGALFGAEPKGQPEPDHTELDRAKADLEAKQEAIDLLDSEIERMRLEDRSRIDLIQRAVEHLFAEVAKDFDERGKVLTLVSLERAVEHLGEKR